MLARRHLILLLLAVAWLAASVFLLAAAPPPLPTDPLEAKLERLGEKDESKVRLSELRGGPVLLKLWATWCLPCRDQARILHDLRGELDRRGFAVYAVDEGEKPAVVRAFLAEEPSHFPVLLDRYQAIARLLAVEELPALVVLRPDGTVAAVNRGLTKADELPALLDAVSSAAASE